jgi:hypothetical protein
MQKRLHFNARVLRSAAAAAIVCMFLGVIYSVNHCLYVIQRRRERRWRGGRGSSGGADDDGGDNDSQHWLDSVAEEAGEADSLLAG